MATPRILVTNDDGIGSEGLRRLATALAEEFDVVVAAPSKDMSGSGTGIGAFTSDTGVGLRPAKLRGLQAYAVAGPPGLAVTAAMLGAFGPVPDLVVSGPNAGMNTGHSTIHSGTVGAALTARTFGGRGMAISLAESDPWHWDTAVTAGVAIAGWMLGRTKSPHVLNVNVPALPLEDVRGIHWADLDEFGSIRVASADVPNGRLQFTLGVRTEGADPASDTALCGQGFVTVTPLTTIEPAPFPDVAAAELWPATEDVARN